MSLVEKREDVRTLEKKTKEKGRYHIEKNTQTTKNTKQNKKFVLWIDRM